VGKSALLARVTQIARYNLEVRHMMEEGNNWPDSKIYLVEYFIRRGATDNANHFFDSLNQRLDLLFNLRLEYGKTEGEKQALFTSRLQLIAKQIKDEEQLIFIIDGLDEIKKGDPLLSLLPRIIPAKIKFIYGARPQQELRFTFYEQLHREQRKQFDALVAKVNSLLPNQTGNQHNSGNPKPAPAYCFLHGYGYHGNSTLPNTPKAPHCKSMSDDAGNPRPTFTKDQIMCKTANGGPIGGVARSQFVMKGCTKP
jgi:hypothetical protein